MNHWCITKSVHPAFSHIARKTDPRLCCDSHQTRLPTDQTSSYRHIHVKLLKCTYTVQAIPCEKSRTIRIASCRPPRMKKCVRCSIQLRHTALTSLLLRARAHCTVSATCCTKQRISACLSCHAARTSAHTRSCTAHEKYVCCSHSKVKLS